VFTYEQTDHVELHINEETVIEPGLTRVNAAVIEDP
jgi:hypothetical protein